MEGWETTEEAWFESLKSEVPQQLLQRCHEGGALHWKGGPPDEVKDALGGILYDFEGGAVADTGHIPGEAHGHWENREWCEHRGG
ncbi:hypothetical protein [Thermococcus peptonophilus]|uniref:hypothetical protein n=1 Tax=Thermococcus peptonophilus TaxID=53952 RepID=UPI000B091EFF